MAVFDLSITYHQQIRNLLDGVFPNLETDLLVSQVRINPKPVIFQSVNYIVNVARLAICNVQYDRLSWRQPSGKFTCIVFDQNTNESLSITGA